MKNITNGKRIIGEIVKSNKCDEIFHNALIEALIRFHPTKKIRAVEYLVVRYSVQFHEKMLCFKNIGEEEEDKEDDEDEKRQAKATGKKLKR